MHAPGRHAPGRLDDTRVRRADGRMRSLASVGLATVRGAALLEARGAGAACAGARGAGAGVCARAGTRTGRTGRLHAPIPAGRAPPACPADSACARPCGTRVRGAPARPREGTCAASPAAAPPPHPRPRPPPAQAPCAAAPAAPPPRPRARRFAPVKGGMPGVGWVGGLQAGCSAAGVAFGEERGTPREGRERDVAAVTRGPRIARGRRDAYGCWQSAREGCWRGRGCARGREDEGP